MSVPKANTSACHNVSGSKDMKDAASIMRSRLKPQDGGQPPMPNTKEKQYGIYVGNLPFSVTDEELGALFAPYGKVQSATIMKNNRGSKGFGYVTLDTNESCELAQQALNGRRQSFGCVIEVYPLKYHGDRVKTASPKVRTTLKCGWIQDEIRFSGELLVSALALQEGEVLSGILMSGSGPILTSGAEEVLLRLRMVPDEKKVVVSCSCSGCNGRFWVITHAAYFEDVNEIKKGISSASVKNIKENLKKQRGQKAAGQKTAGKRKTY